MTDPTRTSAPRRPTSPPPPVVATHALDAPPPPPPQWGTRPPPPRRLDGIDIARGLAIVGMVVIHVAAVYGGDLRDGEPVSLLTTMAYGRASTLFAFVAGLGITLGSRRGTFAENATRLAYRAAWLLPLGLLLELLGTPVAVILPHYALWFVLAIPFLRAPTWLLTSVTAVGMVLGPTVLVVAQVAQPTWFSPRDSGVLFGLAGDLLLVGYYPTVSWVFVVLAGMAVARLPLADRGTATRVLAVGVGTALLGYLGTPILDRAVDLGGHQRWFSTVGHADTPPEMIAATGVAAAVTAACILLADLTGPLLLPLVRFGRVALTMYVGHIVVYALFREAMLARSVAEITTTTAWVTGVGVLGATAWLAAFRRGPLESLDRAGWEHLVHPLLPAAWTAPGAARGR